MSQGLFHKDDLLDDTTTLAVRAGQGEDLTAIIHAYGLLSIAGVAGAIFEGVLSGGVHCFVSFYV